MRPAPIRRRDFALLIGLRAAALGVPLLERPLRRREVCAEIAVERRHLVALLEHLVVEPALFVADVLVPLGARHKGRLRELAEHGRPRFTWNLAFESAETAR